MLDDFAARVKDSARLEEIDPAVRSFQPSCDLSAPSGSSLMYLYRDQLSDHPELATSMFRDRAIQFGMRLGWDVAIDEHGLERDEYDELNPLYAIWTNSNGLHGGSMRFLPTTGPTMVNDHFGDLTGGIEIRSPLIWECTRFCLSRSVESKGAGCLMVACGEIMRGFGLTHVAGVFDHRMRRIYRRLGAEPEVLGGTGSGREKICVGLWSYEAANRNKVYLRAGVGEDQSKVWFEKAFGRSPR